MKRTSTKMAGENVSLLKKGMIAALLLATWLGEVPAAAQDRHAGTLRFREKARRLAEQFTRETRTEADLRIRGQVSYADSKPLQIGDLIYFRLDKADDGEREKVPAYLKRIGKHCYVVVERGQKVSPEKLDQIVAYFDERIYPTNTAWFGSEWKPGVDGDPRVFLFLASGMENMDGYFDPTDEYTTDKCPESNEREILYLATERLENIDDFMGQLVAHEFQHMTHWNQDPKEDTWVEEGLSEFAATLYGEFPFTAQKYFQHPDRCLINWEDGKDASNYGQSFLFTCFLVNRLATSEKERQNVVRRLAACKERGIPGINEIVSAFDKTLSFDQLFREFCAASMLYQKFSTPAGSYRFDAFVAEHLAEGQPSFLEATRSFQEPVGFGKDRMKIWATCSYRFRLKADTTRLHLFFRGKTFRARGGNNQFDIGLAWLPGKNDGEPQIAWHTPRGNEMVQDLVVPSGRFEQLLLIICQRGPRKKLDGETNWPAIPYQFELKNGASGSSFANTRGAESRRPVRPNSRESVRALVEDAVTGRNPEGFEVLSRMMTDASPVEMDWLKTASSVADEVASPEGKTRVKAFQQKLEQVEQFRRLHQE